MALPYQKISFIGLGLIGGSLLKRMKEIYPECTYYGCTKTEKTLALAKKEGLISAGSCQIEDVPKDSDIVFVCTPISMVKSTVLFLHSHLNPEATITDIASVKEGLEIPPLASPTYIPGHPMAGNEKVGFSHSDPAILQGATYVLMKQGSGPLLDRLNSFLESLAFKVVLLSDGEHDRAVALTSHLPYLLATTLMLATRQLSQGEQEQVKILLSSGFVDTSRVASSDPSWGRDICQFNTSAVLAALEDAISILSKAKEDIQDTNFDAIQSGFEAAKKYRETVVSREINGKKI